ncbi:MAG TPA: RHS repeat-associated core domain-containing protein [Lacunisphaera sp.]|nr:RHS repeat-associated core domain-containing protein [Lacunisphaera sp.]
MASATSYATGSTLASTVVRVIDERSLVLYEDMGRTLAVIRADQTQESYRPFGFGTYVSGVFDRTGYPYTHWREIKFNGTTAAGDYTLTSYDSVNIIPIGLVANKSTMEVTICGLNGLPIRKATYVHTGSGNFSSTPISSEDFTYDVAGRLLTRTLNNGDVSTYTYSNGLLASMTDPAGTVTEYGNYDEVWRVRDVTKKGSTDIVTRLAYNAANQVLTETVGSGQTETLVTSRSYDLSGRPTSVTPPGLGATGIAYDQSARTRITTAPDTGTTIETYQLDGQLASVTGSAVVSRTYTYSLADGGFLTRCDHGTSSRYEKTWTDWLGRAVKTERPGWTGQHAFIEKFSYDATRGLRTKYERLDDSNNRLYDDVLYEYDNHAQLTRSGLDVGNGGTLVTASGLDRVMDTSRAFEPVSGEWWLREETTSYPNGSAHTESLVRTRLSGFGGNRSEVETTTTNGAVITRTVAVNTSTKTVTATTSQAGLGSRTETVVNGLPAGVIASDGLTFSTGYDTLGRASTQVDSRSLTTTIAYKTGSTLPETVSDGTGTLVTYQYDTSGRVKRQGDAAAKYTYFKYNTRGQLERQWGHASPPVEHGYHADYGDHETQKTYRGGTGWTDDDWPGTGDNTGASPGTADTVTWNYHAATGLLNSKTDALGHAVNFTYNACGQTDQRIADRGPSSTVTTTYNYDRSTGELTGVGYPSGTAALTYHYDRLGHIYRVDDATDTRTFDLCACGRTNSETLPSSFYGTRVLTYQYEGSGGVMGRYKGFQLGASANSSSDLEQTYGFTSGGRFDTLATKRNNNATSRTFQYGYLTNSSLVNALSITGGHAFTVTCGYNSTRDLLESVDSQWSGASQAKFEYTHTALMQRKTAKQSGAAFADYWTGSGYSSVYNVYAYNDRGGVETAAMYRGNTVSSSPAATEELPGRRFEYRYDSIGNRTLTRGTAGATGDDEDYTADGTNRYTAKENNVVRFAGTVGPGVAVTVTGATLPADQLDRAWSVQVVPANTGGMVNLSTTVFAANPGGGTAGADLLGTASKTIAVPARSQGFDYDYAGNLTGDGLWTYEYDAEDRLVAMQTDPAAIGTGKIANADARRLEFLYDYLGRRVQKIVRDGRNTATGLYSSTPLKKDRYLYDDWNLIAEFDATSTLTLVRSYTWGLDVQGSLSATGGVGALLQIRDHALSRTWLPAYDGNGNVIALLDSEAGSAAIAAVYEYGPFGEPLRTEIRDNDAAAVSFRFSTKFTDAETGLVCYGHRYYSATLGRFINRDPIEEDGGLNLYGFAGNDGVNGWDYLGLAVGMSEDPFLTITPRSRPPDYRVNPWEDGTTTTSADFLGRRFESAYNNGGVWNSLRITDRPGPVFGNTANAPNRMTGADIAARIELLGQISDEVDSERSWWDRNFGERNPYKEEARRLIMLLGAVGMGIDAYNLASDTPIDARSYDFNSSETGDLATLGHVSQSVGVAAAGAAAGATEALGSAAGKVRIVPSGDGRIRLSSPQAGSLFPRPQPLVFKGTAKHAPGGHGTLMDLDHATAQTLLNRSIQVGKQRYAFHNGKLYEFKSDNAGTWHGYPIPGNEAPPTALRQLVLRNDINPAEYNRLRKGK